MKKLNIFNYIFLLNLILKKNVRNIYSIYIICNLILLFDLLTIIFRFLYWIFLFFKYNYMNIKFLKK